MIESIEEVWRGGDMEEIMVEKMVIGEGGMKMYKENIIEEMREIKERKGVMIEVDEVMKGWGRKGKIFEWEKEGIKKDIICK